MPADPLHFGDNVGGLPVRIGWDDYGPIGKGASLAHTVLAENGDEYIIKGPTFTPAHVHVAANELVAARLASVLELPILDHCLVRLDDHLFFGSQFMPKPSFFPQTTKELFDKCENRDRAYDVVAFDCWIVNIDRHHENLLVRVQRARGDRHFLILNDHSHCLYAPGVDRVALQAQEGAAPDAYVKLGFIKDAVSSRKLAENAVDRIESVSDLTIEGIVNSLPDEFMPDPLDREALLSFLIARRDHVRQSVCGSGFFSLH